MNVYGSHCCYWVPAASPRRQLTKKEQDAIERNLTIEEQLEIPPGTVCEFFDLMTLKCDYQLCNGKICETMGAR